MVTPLVAVGKPAPPPPPSPVAAKEITTKGSARAAFFLVWRTGWMT